MSTEALTKRANAALNELDEVVQTLARRADEDLAAKADLNEARWAEAAADYAQERRRRQELVATIGLQRADRTAVAVMLVTPGGGCVYLARRDASCEVFPAKWECPAGKVDPGDASPQAAAVRELREETGLEVGTERLVPAGLAIVDDGRALSAVFLFWLQLGPGEQPGLTEPDKRGRWMNFHIEEPAPADGYAPGAEILLTLLRNWRSAFEAQQRRVDAEFAEIRAQTSERRLALEAVTP
jgi:8-oxo-dGTP pyrophosphatase MutT (NUDIX family)